LPQRLTRRTSKATGEAVSLLIILQEKVDPYDRDRHFEDCDGNIWAEDGESVLLDLDCPACSLEAGMVARIIEDTGSADYYDMALSAFDDHAYLEAANLHPSEIDVATWEYAQLVTNEIRKREKQLSQQQSEKP
jgi:hypothetical protein